MGNCAISFGTSAFYNCKKLKQVNISDAASWCKSSFTDEDSTPLYYGGDLYIDGNLLTNLVIPSGSGVTKIPNYAFINCSGLESVTIPDGVTSIGSQAFDGCSGLRNVTIPASVTTIGYAAFQDCNDFDTVFYGGTVEQWYAIEISQCNDALYRADLKCICFHHSGTHFAAIAPTYDEGGNIEHWYCSGCGKYFSDAACTQELADVTLLPRAPDVTAALTADGVLTVTGALSENAATTNTVLLAVYQNGQLLCVKDISDLAQNELRFVCGDMQGADTVKLFRLGSGLEPCFAVCAIRIS